MSLRQQVFYQNDRAGEIECSVTDVSVSMRQLRFTKPATQSTVGYAWPAYFHPRGQSTHRLTRARGYERHHRGGTDRHGAPACETNNVWLSDWSQFRIQVPLWFSCIILTHGCVQVYDCTALHSSHHFYFWTIHWPLMPGERAVFTLIYHACMLIVSRSGSQQSNGHFAHTNHVTVTCRWHRETWLKNSCWKGYQLSSSTACISLFVLGLLPKWDEVFPKCYVLPWSS